MRLPKEAPRVAIALVAALGLTTAISSFASNELAASRVRRHTVYEYYNRDLTSHAYTTVKDDAALKQVGYRFQKCAFRVPTHKEAPPANANSRKFYGTTNIYKFWY